MRRELVDQLGQFGNPFAIFEFLNSPGHPTFSKLIRIWRRNAQTKHKCIVVKDLQESGPHELCSVQYKRGSLIERENVFACLGNDLRLVGRQLAYTPDQGM